MPGQGAHKSEKAGGKSANTLVHSEAQRWYRKAGVLGNNKEDSKSSRARKCTKALERTSNHHRENHLGLVRSSDK
jgi:hypothetical protein